MPSTVFISEYICSGALADQELPPSLAAEGGAMLAAAVEDLAALPGIEVTTTLDGRLNVASEQVSECVGWAVPTNPNGPHATVGTAHPTPTARLASLALQIRRGARVIEVANPADEIACFDRLARECDATLVIAPEFDRILYDRCRRVEESGSRLLGSSSQAVDVAADKYLTNRLLDEHGIPTTEGVCWRVSEWASGRVGGQELKSGGLKSDDPQLSTLNFQLFPNPRPPTPDPRPLLQFPAVLKPRFGAGSQCTYLIRRASDAPGIFEQALQEGIGEQALLETYVPGQPASVAVLIGENHVVPLPVCRQILSDDGRFRYLGGSIPFDSSLARQAQEMAVRTIRLVPGLRGYVGVDLILDQDAPGVSVVEINPRLTTSYVGLRAALGQNLMAALIGPDPSGFSISEQVARVGFTPSGKVSWE